MTIGNEELTRTAKKISNVGMYGFIATGVILFFAIVDILQPTPSTTLFSGIVLGVLIGNDFIKRNKQ